VLAEERRSRIVTLLERHGAVRVSDLASDLGVSDMTVRRDLEMLQLRGVLQKVHGGAVVVDGRSGAEPGFVAKSTRQRTQKEAIAAHAASLVPPGAAIAVSAGTTTHALARYLVGTPDLTVVTNSVWVADVLHRGGHRGPSVLLTGGLRTPSDALVGPHAMAAFESLNVDMVFLGVHGMALQGGFSTPNLHEAETNRAMIASGRRLVVVADSTKWGLVGLSSMAELHEADTVVSDMRLPPLARTELAGAVRELALVEPEGLMALDQPP
jgi:DeoR/GlpR family transcriptional regulator of sugar metabolism